VPTLPKRAELCEGQEWRAVPPPHYTVRIVAIDRYRHIVTVRRIEGSILAMKTTKIPLERFFAAFTQVKP
jgi:hypothetical protein